MLQLLMDLVSKCDSLNPKPNANVTGGTQEWYNRLLCVLIHMF
jgi:hypothetical protein